MINSNINFYSLFLFISLTLNIFSIVYFTYKWEGGKDTLMYLLTYETAGIMFGSLLYSYIFKNQEFSFSSVGAGAGALLGTGLYCLVFKKDLRKTVSIVSLSLPLIYGISKLGCFLAGCCHGIEYNGYFSITYNYSEFASIGVSYFPVQLCESISFIAIYLIMIFLQVKNKFSYKWIGLNFMLMGLTKFGWDFLRYSHNTLISQNQIFSLMLTLVGIGLIVYSKCKEK